MPLLELLAGVRLLAYDPARGPQQPAQQHLRAVRTAMVGLLPPVGLEVRVSGAAVNLPRIPWIAILRPDVTRTAQSGLYVVYLYDADLGRLYLTMNQGATAHREHAQKLQRPKGVTIDAAAIAELNNESLAIRAALPTSLVGTSPRTIDLRSDHFLPRAYEAGTIAAVEYDSATLPHEDVLRTDLSRFLKIYDAAVDARQRLTAANPTKFYTPAVSAPAEPDASADLFRPKNASDYVAHVGAQTQVRSRRHEAVVKAFGEHAATVGWVPATNVHPRDLVVRKGTAEVLCEVKVVKANAESAVREAVGQLITYRHFLYSPSHLPAALMAVFSDPVGDAFVELLESIGIGAVWSCGGAQWAGSSTAVALGLV